MDNEQVKPSENPYEPPRSKEHLDRTSVGCVAAAVFLLVLCSLALSICLFLWWRVDSFELIGFGWSPPATKNSLVSIASVTMFVIAALVAYGRHFSRWRG
jgi:hypothetical protein